VRKVEELVAVRPEEARKLGDGERRLARDVNVVRADRDGTVEPRKEAREAGRADVELAPRASRAGGREGMVSDASVGPDGENAAIVDTQPDRFSNWSRPPAAAARCIPVRKQPAARTSWLPSASRSSSPAALRMSAVRLPP
jgi:hypothetical protein